MEKLLKSLIDLKIPSIIILGVFAYLTFKLLEKSPEFSSAAGIGGFICLCVTIFLGIYAFIEFLIKERYESIIKTQQDAMKKISITHSIFEDRQQKSLTDTASNLGQNKYTDISEKTETGT